MCLSTVIRNSGRISNEVAIHYAIGICSALAAAHASGVVHRDIKPQNILVDASQRVYVSDFGMARSARDDASFLTTGDSRTGTPRYMSPEQILCAPLDHRTDIYSFGAVCYEMLTGKPPFPDYEALDGLHQRAQLEPRDPRTINPSIHPGLSRIVMKCLRPVPDSRYQSADAVLADLFPLSMGLKRRPIPAWLGRTLRIGRSLAWRALAITVFAVCSLFLFDKLDPKQVRHYFVMTRSWLESIHERWQTATNVEPPSDIRETQKVAISGGRIASPGVLSLSVSGTERKISDSVLSFQLIEKGAKAVYICSQNSSKLLRTRRAAMFAYDPARDTRRRILETDNVINSIEEFKARSGMTMLVVTQYDQNNHWHLAIVNPERGMIAQVQNAAVLERHGNELVLGYFDSGEALRRSQPRTVKRLNLDTLVPISYKRRE